MRKNRSAGMRLIAATAAAAMLFAGIVPAEEPVIIEEKAFTDAVTYTFVVRCADEAAFLARLADLSEGTAEPLRCEELYLAWPEEVAP